MRSFFWIILVIHVLHNHVNRHVLVLSLQTKLCRGTLDQVPDRNDAEFEIQFTRLNLIKDEEIIADTISNQGEESVTLSGRPTSQD